MSASDVGTGDLEAHSLDHPGPSRERWRSHLSKLGAAPPLGDAILASWSRSSEAGVPREGIPPFRCVDEATLARLLAENRELIEVARPHVEWVSSYMAGVPHVVYITDRNGIVLHALGNPELREAFCLAPGYDWSEAAMGTNGAGTAIVADRPVAVVGEEHYASGLGNCTCTAAPIHRGGEVVGAIDISTSVADASPDRLALVGHAAFVIERELALVRAQDVHREMADRLRERERRLLTINAQLEALLDNTTAVIYMVDREARLLRINRRWETLFGVASANAIGRSLYEFFPRNLADRFIANNLKVLAERRAMEFEEEVVVGGETRLYLSVKVPLLEDSGEPYAVCGISTDITERKAAEQRKRSILEEANERKQRFIAALAHELRRPLSAVVASAEVLQSAGADRSQIETASGIIMRQALHITSLVEQVLEASRIATQRMNLEPSEIDLRAIIEQAVEACRPAIEGKGQRLELAMPASALALRGDATRLTQVFENLLDNACRYSPLGRRIWIAAEQADDCVVVTVRDEGRGIAPELQSRIFELLFQADAERNAGGLGIGLSLVRGIVEAHGGRIDVHSDGPGCGTEFTVRLPAL